MIFFCNAFAARDKLSSTELSRAIWPINFDEPHNLFIYVSGAFNKAPLGAAAKTDNASGKSLAQWLVHSKGSTAISIFKSLLGLPISSPI